MPRCATFSVAPLLWWTHTLTLLKAATTVELHCSTHKGVTHTRIRSQCTISGNITPMTTLSAPIIFHPTNWQSFYGTSDIGVWFSVEQLGGHPHEIPEVYARCSPITYAHQCTTPTLMVQGEADWRCPAEQSEQFYTVLKANGCPVEMLRIPGGAHGGTRRGTIAMRA